MKVGQKIVRTFHISMREQEMFHELSGDTNPIHLDKAFANAAGFEHPVVYGGIFVAKVSEFLGTIFPGHGCIWTKLKIDFRSPLYVDQPAALTFTCTYSNEELNVWQLAFEIANDFATVANGKLVLWCYLIWWGSTVFHHFDPAHPLLQEILADPILSTTKLISEPWDTGMGGWQVGKFPAGYQEWNDHFRDRVRQFWLRDVAETRAWTVAPQGVADLSAALSGSTAIYGEKRTPLASVNFVTAHDGFTLADLVSYDVKHNKANGESNRDGTDSNTSFNFGEEGVTNNEAITLHRRRAMRSLLGTLFVSAGIPMMTAGDETGRTQNGNNNAYCHDSALTWLNWDLDGWQRAHLESTKRLIHIRRENPALKGTTAARPSVRRTAEGVIEEATIEPFVGLMDWYTADGLPMTLDDWNSSLTRTVQYLVGTPAVDEVQNRVLVVIHGLETSQDVVFPERADVAGYTLLWDSSHAAEPEHRVIAPGATHAVGPTSIAIYRVD